MLRRWQCSGVFQSANAETEALYSCNSVVDTDATPSAPAMMSGRFLWHAYRPAAAVLFALVLVASGTAAQAQGVSAAQAGVAAAVRGEVRKISFAAAPPAGGQAVAASVGRVVASGDRIFLGDKIETGPSAGLQIMLLDETIFTIGPNAAMVIDKFVYDPSTDAGEVTASIVKGAFRFVSGRIAKRSPSEMNVKLPVATIGIRGTSVAGEVVEETPTTPASAEVILLGPGAENNADERSGRIIVGNAGTSVEISRPGFGTTISNVQSPPAPPGRVPPARIAALGGNLAGTGGSGGDGGDGGGSQGTAGQGGQGGSQGEGEGGSQDDAAADNDAGDNAGAGGDDTNSGNAPPPGSGTSAGGATPANASQGSGDTNAPGPTAVGTVSGPGGGGTTFAAGSAGATGSAGAAGSTGGSSPTPPSGSVAIPNLGGFSGLTLGSSLQIVSQVSSGQSTGQTSDNAAANQSNAVASQLSSVTTFQQLLSNQVSGTGTYTMNNVPLARLSSPTHNGNLLTASGSYSARVDADFNTKKLQLIVNNVSYNYQTVVFGTVIPQNGNSFTFDSNAQPAGGQFDDNNYGNELGNVEKVWNSTSDPSNFPVVPTEPFSGVKHQVEISARMLNDVPNGEIAASASVNVKVTVTHGTAGVAPTVLAGGQTANRN